MRCIKRNDDAITCDKIHADFTAFFNIYLGEDNAALEELNQIYYDIVRFRRAYYEEMDLSNTTGFTIWIPRFEYEALGVPISKYTERLKKYKWHKDVGADIYIDALKDLYKKSSVPQSAD